MAVAASCFGATNDVASTLQRGLFEEEANQNLTAAIQAYKAVASQYDKDRKLAATAIYRLGECYRKQGATNEASAQYERILRDFSDQTQLATLSRKELKSLGNTSSPAVAPETVSGGASSPRVELLTLESQIAEFKKLPKEQLRVAIQQSFPNPVLTSLMQKLAESEQSLNALKKEYGPQNAEVLKMSEVVDTVSQQINTQTEAALRGLEIKRDVLKKTADALQAEPRPRVAAGGDPLATKGTDLLTASEADEVKKIQAMIKDSPDLINAQSDGFTPLQRAAMQGQLTVAQFLLANGAEVDAKDALNSSGNTALHYAAIRGHKAMAQLLLDNKASVRAINISQRTPLHFAAANGFRSVAELLISRGADVNAKNSTGATPLILAVANGFRSVAELLLTNGADINVKTSEIVISPNQRTAGSSLVVAANRGELPMIQLLLTNHADITITDDKGCTPLHVAAKLGNVPVMAELLAQGADVDLRGSGSETRGWTPLLMAVNANQKEAVEFLLKNKADPNARIGTRYGEGGDNYTALLIATARVLPEIVDMLLEGGADANLGNGLRYPLLNAVSNENPAGRKQMVQSLVSHGARADVRDANIATPLQLAALRGDADAVAAVLAGHPDLNAQDKNGNSALHFALYVSPSFNVTEVVKLLLEAGINPNLRDKDGTTALHLAVTKNKRDLAELLLASKANPNLQNNQGQTPLDIAQQNASSPFGGIGTLNIVPGSGMLSPNQTGTYSIPGNTSPASPTTNQAPQSMAEILRGHGAIDDLQRTNQISVSRSSVNYSAPVFIKGTIDWNEFTLYELLAVQYRLLTGGPVGSRNAVTPEKGNFPDFAHVRIRRPSATSGERSEQTIDVAAAFESGDCAANVPLHWGDIVEIPELEHVLSEQWHGLAFEASETLKKCLSGEAQLIIKGRTNTISLSLQPPTMATFLAAEIVRNSKQLLSSSDLSRIKVIRRDSVTGETREWILDCSDRYHLPDLIIRADDRIEVPEKMGVAASGPLLSQPFQSGAIPAQASRPSRSQPNPKAPNTPALEDDDQPKNPGFGRSMPSRTLRLPTPKAPDQLYLESDGLLYSPNAEDSQLLSSDYQRDKSAPTRQGQAWEQRATADIEGRGGNTAVWTGKEMIVFGGEGMGVSYDNGARFDPQQNAWEMLPRKNGPSSRTGGTAVWTGKEMIVWGGFGGRLGNDTNRDDGARYYPADNIWKPVTTEEAPEARFDHSAVWTGKEMLIWGGYTDSRSRYQGAYSPAQLNSGGRYNPSKDSWQPITTKGAPSKRFANGAVWSGKEMLIWGGADATKALGDGARYNPIKDTWKPINAKGAPGARSGLVALWTGKEMIVWGGGTRDNGPQAVCFQDGARYNPDTDTWKPMSRTGAPKGRVIATAVWTGKEMIIWGGVNDAESRGVSDSNRYIGTGALYNPETDTWTPITNVGAPSPRLASGVWDGEGLLLFGGYNGMHLNDTWFFSPKETLYPYVKKASPAQ